MSRAFVVLLASAVLCLSACDLPFGIGSPTTRALEDGVVASLQQASFEISGVYTQTVVAPPPPIVSGARVSAPAVGTRWTLDLQVSSQLPARRMTVSNADVKLDAIVLPTASYFSGQAFLLQFLGGDPQTRDLARAAGNAWWKGPAGLVPQLVDFTYFANFRTTFLGSAVSSRTDHLSIDGSDAVELSGPRADVYVASTSPNRLLRLVIHERVTIDGIGESDLHYSNYDKDFNIIAPRGDVIDFSNLSTLPPIYSVISVDTSKCGSPCVVSALLKNLGGPTGAVAPSTITFTITDPATKSAAGSCTATVSPDVGFNATTTASCTIPLSGPPPNAAVVTATPSNPGRG